MRSITIRCRWFQIANLLLPRNKAALLSMSPVCDCACCARKQLGLEPSGTEATTQTHGFHQSKSLVWTVKAIFLDANSISSFQLFAVLQVFQQLEEC